MTVRAQHIVKLQFIVRCTFLFTANSSIDLVFIWSSAGSAPCKQQAPLIGELHRVLSAVAPSSVAVARLNVDHNWIDPAYFPASEKSLPNIKFFARGNKVCILATTRALDFFLRLYSLNSYVTIFHFHQSTPTRFGGERSVAGLVRFVHRCLASQSDGATSLVTAPSSAPTSSDSFPLSPSASSSSAAAAALFDLDAALALASRADRTLALAARCRTAARTARRDMALHPKLLETDRLSVEAIVGAMQALEELEASAAAATEAAFDGHDTRLERLEAAWAEWDGSSSVRSLKQEIKVL
jgi:hypothetical protein